jgi:hypothetical protein
MAVRVLLVLAVLAALYGCGQASSPADQQAGWPPPVGEEIVCYGESLDTPAYDTQTGDYTGQCHSTEGFAESYVYHCEVLPADVKGVPLHRGYAAGGDPVPIEGTKLKAGNCTQKGS